MIGNSLCIPHITYNGDDKEICLEWWAGDKKLVIYLGDEGILYIKVWGLDMTDEMEDGHITSMDKFLEVYTWLLTKETV